MDDDYIPPSFKENAFNCPYCRAYAHQEWWPMSKVSIGTSKVKPAPPPTVRIPPGGVMEDLFLCSCSRCENYSLWINDKMVYPKSSIAPFPINDMPENVKIDFLEARNIVSESPRGAAALLRLALQKLMPHLGESGNNINNDIKNLVKKGLDVQIQQSLDYLRVIGNNAVHPGELDLQDDLETALNLFDLLNIIVNLMIIQPKKINRLYNKLPGSTRNSIKKRDKN